MAGVTVCAKRVQMSDHPGRRAGPTDLPPFGTIMRAGIVLRPLLLLSGLILASGCTWAVREQTNETVRELADHPFDIAPEPHLKSPSHRPELTPERPPGRAFRRADETRR